MTKKIAESLNMKSLEEIMEEVDAIDDEEINSALPAVLEDGTGNELMTHSDMKGDDHAEAMDEVYDKAMDVADKIVDMGMNMDPSRAPRLLEVANQWMKTAADAKISKRDAQLKLMKLIIDQRKLALEERAAGLSTGELQGDVIFEGDRNTLLKMIREQKAREQEGKDTE